MACLRALNSEEARASVPHRLRCLWTSNLHNRSYVCDYSVLHRPIAVRWCFVYKTKPFSLKLLSLCHYVTLTLKQPLYLRLKI